MRREGGKKKKNLKEKKMKKEINTRLDLFTLAALQSIPHVFPKSHSTNLKNIPLQPDYLDFRCNPRLNLGHILPANKRTPSL